MMLKILLSIKNIAERFIYLNYKRTIPEKVKKIQNKERIKVLFVLAETSKWKTELLYQTMLKNNRFEPILGITFKTDDRPTESSRKLMQLVSYLKRKEYPYQELVREGYIKEYIKPDIIIYQEPYSSTILRGHNYLHNLECLFVSVTYGFHSVLLPFNNIGGLKEIAWFDCYENESTAKDAIKYTKGKRKNIRITGLPMSESFLKYSRNKNVWKECGSHKKIIWAPHHSIGFKYETITYGNFLEIADQMINLAEKYKNMVQWAFKPHPLLKFKLELKWGKEKTDKFYSYWKESDHTQLEEGEYVDLFMQSDAMIHDCDTFTIEYLYSNNPVLYLYRPSHYADVLNSFAKLAHDVHYSGNSFADIERFVQMVVKDKDPMKGKRTEFFMKELDTSIGRNASINIIKEILG